MEDYSKKDFPSTYEDLLSMVKSSTNLWNPSNSTEADPGVVILKLMAFLEDRAGYRFDMAHAQNYLDSVSDRQSAQELLQMLGYTMQHARAATGEIRLQVIDTTTGFPDGGIVVPIFSKVTDRTKSIKFFTTTQATITEETKQNIIVVSVQAGEPFQVVKDGVAYYTLKDVDERGRLYLGKSNLAQNGIYVFSDYNITGEQLTDRASHKWAYVDFSILKPRGNFYTVGEGENGEMYIQFPDNFEDLLTGQYIEVWATYTEGAASNIAANTLALFDESTVFVGSDNLTIAQPNDIYTGQDAESIADASKHYYETKDVCDTLVTAEDFATAIRYLVNGAGEEISGALPGQRFFSNAVVQTAQSRRLPIRTKVYDKEYTLFEQVDTTTPCNQLNVVGMQFTSDYAGSFKIKPVDTGIESEFERQLQDNHALDVDIVDATDTTKEAAKIDRILAVTTPSMTLRISRNATITDLALKQKIRDYFYSTYRADNIEFGKELDYQTIVDDIRVLDPSINSVSMEELKYRLYKRYAPVDGVTVELGAEDKLRAAAKSALAGIIPLYRFYNRQNAPSKENVFYSLAASSTNDGSGSETAAEVVTALPFSASHYEKLESAEVGNLVFLSEISSIANRFGDQGFLMPLVSRNQMLQFRRPLVQDSSTFGYGMQYVFTRYYVIDTELVAVDVEDTEDNVLGDGTVLAKGSKIVPRKGLELPEYLYDKDANGGKTPPCDKEGVVTVDSLTLSGVTEIGATTILAAGSGLAPGSLFRYQGGVIDFNPSDVPADDAYLLKRGETLRIYTSKGELKETVVAGQYVKTHGLNLVHQPNPKTLISLSTVESIATQEEQMSDIGIEFKYLLSLRNKRDNDILTITASGYMLEEGEFFIYADKAISEYVILGAGTVLRPAGASQVELTVSYMSSVEDVTRDSGFKDVPAPIEGVVYEFQNFRYPCTAVFKNREDAEAGSFPPTIGVSDGWTALTENCSIYKSESYTQQDSDQSILSQMPLLQAFIEDCGVVGQSGLTDESLSIGSFDPDRGWEVRRVLLLETDEDNVCFVSRPVNLTVGGKQIRSSNDDDVPAGVISASSSFSVILSSTSTSLFAEGVSLQLSKADMSQAFSVVGKASSSSPRVGTFVLTAEASSLGEDPVSISLATPFVSDEEGNITGDAFKKIIFSFNVEEKVTSGRVTLTPYVNGKKNAGVKISSLLTGSQQEEDEFTFDCSSKDAARSGEVLQLTPPEGGWFSLLEEGASDIRLVVQLTFESLKGADGAEVVPANITLSQLSYVMSPSAESGLSDEPVSDLESQIRSVSANSQRFNWLYTPTEDFVDPTDASSFFNELHPYNYCTIPYVNFDAASIKIIRER